MSDQDQDQDQSPATDPTPDAPRIADAVPSTDSFVARPPTTDSLATRPPSRVPETRFEPGASDPPDLSIPTRIPVDPDATRESSTRPGWGKWDMSSPDTSIISPPETGSRRGAGSGRWGSASIRIAGAALGVLKFLVACFITALGMSIWCLVGLYVSNIWPIGLILLPLLAVARVPFLIGKRLAAHRAVDFVERGERPTVLLLRSFHDDRMGVQTMSTLSRVLFARYFPWHFTTFEEMLVNLFETCGPVVAIGRPGEVLPPLGAAREWVSNERWQARVEELIARSGLVVLVVGDLTRAEGLRWEAERIFALCPRRKIVLVVPPLADKAVRARWEGLVAMSSAAVPEARGDEIAAMFSEDGTSVVLRSWRRWGRTRRWERDYRSALGPVTSRDRTNTRQFGNGEKVLFTTVFSLFTIVVFYAIAMNMDGTASPIRATLLAVLWLGYGWFILASGDLRNRVSRW